MTNLGFVDLETTSLERPFTADPRNIIWEVGLIVRTDIESNPHPDNDVEYRWFLPVMPGLGNPESLAIGRFDERYPTRTGEGYITSPAQFTHEFHEALMQGLKNDDPKPFLVGNVVSFDEERLAALFYSTGKPYTDLGWLPWHYHLVDVEAFAAGRLGLQPPWKGSTVSETLGVPVPDGQHDALVDARWARDMYDTVLRNAASTIRAVSDELNTAVGEAIGEASMCWTPTPSGVFDSTRASNIADALLMSIRSGL